jgi:hypothetical protein
MMYDFLDMLLNLVYPYFIEDFCIEVHETTRRQRSGGSWLIASPGKEFARLFLEKPFTKVGLVD